MTTPYSAKQEQGGTAVGMTGAEMPSAANPGTPDVAGVAGPAPTATSDPWPGRSATVYAALDQSAASYSAILSQAQQSPGTVVSTAATPGPTNTGEGTYGT